MEYTRNSDLEYYYDNPGAANCGSYALRLQEWYDPEGYFEDIVGNGYDWIAELHEEGYSDTEISNFYLDILVDGMLQEFEDELELCDGRAPTTSDTELIAFNTFAWCDDDYNSEYDFHFKVLRDGEWMEKCGREEVRVCEEDYWGKYIGDPVYMYHKIDMKGANDETEIS